jgi:hypothetical protein
MDSVFSTCSCFDFSNIYNSFDINPFTHSISLSEFEIEDNPNANQFTLGEMNNYQQML